MCHRRHGCRKNAIVSIVSSRLTGLSDAVWFSLPCTGGTPYSHLSYAHGGTAKRKVFAAPRLLLQLWSSARRIICHASAVGTTVCFEWFSLVFFLFFTELGLICSKRDGCVDGLCSRVAKTLGKLLYKPLEIYCNSSVVSHSMNAVCDRSHFLCEGTRR